MTTERLVPSQRFPLLVISQGIKYHPWNHISTWSGIVDCTPTIPHLSGKKKPRASCDGWLVLSCVIRPRECLVLNLDSTEKIKLSIPDHVDIRDYYDAACVLTAPPTDSKCVLGFFAKRRPMALLWRAAQQDWVEQTYGSGRLKQPTACNGKIYGFKKRALAVCEIVDGKLSVTRFRRIPLYKRPNCVEYLVGARGHLFWIIVGPLRWHGNGNLAVDVYKFNETSSLWVQVRDIADDVFFVSDVSSVSLSTANSGVEKGNCIYFLKLGGDDHTLYTYVMEADQLATCTVPCPNAARAAQFIWMLPAVKARDGIWQCLDKYFWGVFGYVFKSFLK